MAGERLATELAHALPGDGEPVGVERRQQVDLSVVQEIGHSRVPSVVVGEVLGHVENELSAERLVAVHVPGKLEHRPPLFSLMYVARHLSEDEIPPLDTSANLVNTHQVGILSRESLQPA